jgi:hypothetical protein
MFSIFALHGLALFSRPTVEKHRRKPLPFFGNFQAKLLNRREFDKWRQIVLKRECMQLNGQDGLTA